MGTFSILRHPVTSVTEQTNPDNLANDLLILKLLLLLHCDYSPVSTCIMVNTYLAYYLPQEVLTLVWNQLNTYYQRESYLLKKYNNTL